jgi:hypothetical protein
MIFMFADFGFSCRSPLNALAETGSGAFRGNCGGGARQCGQGQRGHFESNGFDGRLRVSLAIFFRNDSTSACPELAVKIPGGGRRVDWLDLTAVAFDVERGQADIVYSGAEFVDID